MQKTVKRIFDIIFALMALVLLLPLWVVLAIWIGATSPGGIFFRQRRTGLHGREFNLLKFRSMRINDIADEAQAGTNDPRVTAVGACCANPRSTSCPSSSTCCVATCR